MKKQVQINKRCFRIYTTVNRVKKFHEFPGLSKRLKHFRVDQGHKKSLNRESLPYKRVLIY